jgi:tryptophan 2,3-dioxygenase
VELDERFQKFRSIHILAIHRSIGMGAASLKGRSVDLLAAAATQRFFPELWDIRAHLSDACGGVNGRIRESLPPGPAAAAAPEASPRRRAPQVSSVKGVKRVSRSK